MSEIKMYFKGDSGIKEPIDMNGIPIIEGDLLTRDYGDNEKYKIETQSHYPTEAFYLVKINNKGGFYAESIKPYETFLGEDKYFLLHDFRFKYCKNLTTKQLKNI